MTRVRVPETGSVGFVTDIEPHLLPIAAWTSGKNVRFIDKKVQKFSGSQEVLATPLHEPYYLMQMILDGASYWVYPGLAKVTAYNSATHTDITRTTGGDYTGTVDSLWTGSDLGGLLVLNNGVDVPQHWANISLGTPLTPVPNWPSGYLAKTMVAYKNHLIGFGITQAGVLYPHRILWSHTADPGSMPTSWDIADPTKDAGQTELSDVNSGGIVYGLQLGDAMIIYKDNSIWEMHLSNNAFIFNFSNLFTGVGLAATYAVANIPQKFQHLVYTGDDLIIHNGKSMESILSSRERRLLNTLIEPTAVSKCFMVTRRLTQEIYFFFPSIGASYPDQAFVYNYETGLISKRSIDPVTYMAVGAIEGAAGLIWNSATGTWDTQTDTWQPFNSSVAAKQDILFARKDVTKFYQLEVTNQDDGVNLDTYIERVGIGIAGYDDRGNPVTDLDIRKVISRVWLRMEGGPVTVKVLTQEEITGTTTTSPSMAFNPATDRYVDLPTPMSGVLYGIRIESNADVGWELHGYDLEIQALGWTK